MPDALSLAILSCGEVVNLSLETKVYGGPEQNVLHAYNTRPYAKAQSFLVKEKSVRFPLGLPPSFSARTFCHNFSCAVIFYPHTRTHTHKHSAVDFSVLWCVCSMRLPACICLLRNAAIALARATTGGTVVRDDNVGGGGGRVAATTTGDKGKRQQAANWINIYIGMNEQHRNGMSLCWAPIIMTYEHQYWKGFGDEVKHTFLFGLKLNIRK